MGLELVSKQKRRNRGHTVRGPREAEQDPRGLNRFHQFHCRKRRELQDIFFLILFFWLEKSSSLEHPGILHSSESNKGHFYILLVRARNKIHLASAGTQVWKEALRMRVQDGSSPTTWTPCSRLRCLSVRQAPGTLA